MPTDKAIAEVEELKGILSEAKLIISTDYRGLNVTELSALRRAVREAGGTYRVTKNTMVKIASDEIDRPEISDIVVGPTGFVLSMEDPVAPARALMKHIDENRLDVVINGAFLEGQLVDADRVKYLSSLPGREELVARVMGQMNAPIVNLVSVLSGTVRGLLTVLQAHIDQGGNLAAAVADTDDAEVEVPEGAPEAVAEQAEEPVAEATADEPEAAAEEPVAEAEAEAAEEEPADEPEAADEEPVAEADAEVTEEEPADEPEDADEEPVAEAEAEVTEEEPADEPEDADEEPVAEAEAAEEEAPEADAEETGEAEEDKPAE